MKDCIGIINSNDQSYGYGSLTNNRPEYMLPFAGRYRTIDFTLSNFSEHGLEKVLMFGGKNLRSTLDHVGNGKNWGLDKRHDGLMINPPSYHKEGLADNEISKYYDAIRYFEESDRENIYIADPMVISRINITKAYDEFITNGYDVMFLYREQDDPNGDYLKCNKLIIDKDNNITNIGRNLGTENTFNMYIENMFIKKDLFIKLIKKSIEEGNADTLIQSIFHNKEDIKIGGLQLFRHVEFIYNLQSFYKSNLNMINYGIYADLLLSGNGLKTKSKDEPSTNYLKGNKVKNSIVANGCKIAGEIENSVIFRGVKVGKNAIIKNSIIFQKADIEDDAVIINSIVDKNAVVKKGAFVKGASNQPFIVEKNQVVEN